VALPAPPYQTAGWYDDPEGSAKRRWWNGLEWTSDYQTDSTTPTPAAASGPAEKLAEAESLVASLPGYADRPAPSLATARRSVTRVVSSSLGLGLMADIFAMANLGDPIVFGILAVVAALLAYGVCVLAIHLRFLRTRTNRVLAVLGACFASCAICLVIVTATFGWQIEFARNAASSTGQDAALGQADPGQVVKTRDVARSILLRITKAWAGEHSTSGKWPAAAGTEKGRIVSSYGTTGIQLPANWKFSYTPTADLLAHTATVTDDNGVGMMFAQAYGLYSPTS
jgi:hypothetical protein